GMQCGNTWTDTQIVIEIPSDFDDFQTYFVIVKRNNGLTSDGQDTLTLIDGNPLPSICSLSPLQGPALLPSGHTGLTFIGKSFSADPTLYFWNGNGDIVNPSVFGDVTSDAWIPWGSTSGDQRWSVNPAGTQIISSVAYQQPASLFPTMPFGQWP